MAVIALHGYGTAGVGNGAVNAAGSIPAPLVGVAIAMGRQGLGDLLFGGIGIAGRGVFAPAGCPALGVAGIHAGIVPGVFSGGLAVAKGLGRIVPVAVAAQAVVADLLDLGSGAVGRVGDEIPASIAGPLQGAVNHQPHRGPGYGGIVVRRVDATVTVGLPVALVALGIGNRALDMVGLGAELRGYGHAAPLGHRVAAQAGGGTPLGR